MSWNYRVIRRVETSHTTTEPVFTIAEVFYDDAGAINGWTAEPIWPCGETREELQDDLGRMLGALNKPVMEETDDEKTLREAQPPQRPGAQPEAGEPKETR